MKLANAGLTLRTWWRGGDSWVWLHALAVSICIVAMLGLVGLLWVRSMSHFWPAPVLQFQYQQAQQPSRIYAGQLWQKESAEGESTERWLVGLGNRDLGSEAFQWFSTPLIHSVESPPGLAVIERQRWGPVYGYLVSLSNESAEVRASAGPVAERWANLKRGITEAQATQRRLDRLRNDELVRLNRSLAELGDARRSASAQPTDEAALRERHEQLRQELVALGERLSSSTALLRTADGRDVVIPLSSIVRAYRPNALSHWGKMRLFAGKVTEFMTAAPREANTEGGVFPALFGTVLMVIVMSILVTPLGILVAVYLHEYARQGLVTRLIRITVHNLAGVPSVVYGMFGLGFFVYGVGGRIDQWLYADKLPAPTFGTPGLFWASFTLALLTLPVVIVATEEGLARVPRSLREGSLALGATRFQSIISLALPTAGPALITGLILAVARAAGEVAPLMLVGVVKYAPMLPLDAEFPYLHLERKFMHLGYHIYDLGFHSASVDGVGALVYASALLLVLVVLVLNLSAISIRNRLRERFKELEF